MKFIKISDRFPPFGVKVIVRRISTGKVWSAADNGRGTSIFRNYRASDIEWLDESLETDESLLKKCEEHIDNNPDYSNYTLFVAGYELATNRKSQQK